MIIGTGIGFLVGLVVLAVHLLVSGSKRWHDTYHARHSELMCDHCTARSRAVPPIEALRRWPSRVMGDQPPQGTG